MVSKRSAGTEVLEQEYVEEEYQEVPETEAEVSTEATETKAPRAPRPTFSENLVVVTDLPPQRRGGSGAGRGQSTQYADQLVKIHDDENLHNGWVPIATFHTVTGATTVKRALVLGERKVPEFSDGRIDWASRSSETGSESYLYAKYTPYE